MDLKSSCTLFILAATAPAWLATPVASADMPPEYRNPATAKDYPDADVLALKEVRTFTLHPDGRIDTDHLMVEKILTYHGMDEIGDPHFAFDTAHQTLEVLKSRTYTPEGEVRDTQANGKNEITPFALEKTPDYTHIRQMVVTHVGLDIGATVVTEIAVRDKAPWRSFLEDVVPLQSDEPALLRQVVVQVPAGTEFHHLVVNGNAKLEVSHTDGQDVYTWTLENVPVAKLAFAGPDAHRFLPTLLFTTAPDWATWADKLSARVDAALEDPDGRVAAQGTRLLEDRGDAFARIDALHTFVVDGILTAAWPLDAFDYAIRPATRTLESSHGHALDKAVLLTALLRDAGFEADIALFGPNPLEEEALSALPCLARLTTPLVRVRAEGQTVWLAPTSHLKNTSQRDFIGWEGLTLVRGRDELEALRLPDGANRLSIQLEATLKSDLGVEGHGNITLLGYYAPFYQVRGDKKALDAFATSLIQSVMGRTDKVEASVVELRPFQVRLKVTFSAKAPESEPRVLTVRTGIPSGSLLGASLFIHLSTRSLPLLLPATGEETVSITWSLPKGKTPRFIPKPVKVSGQPGQAMRSWRLENDTLTVTAAAAVRERVVLPADYPTFKQMHDDMAAETSCVVVF